MKCYRSKSGGILPVEMKDGKLVIWDLTCMKPMKNNTSVVRPWGTEENFYNNACTESPARTVEEMRQWKRSIDDALARKQQAAYDMAEAERQLVKLESRVRDYTYVETQKAGYTWQVTWGGEYETNPKTGNEFFSEADAKARYWELYEQHREEIEQKRKEWGDDEVMPFDEYFSGSNDFFEASDYLDDCVNDEEHGAFDGGDDNYYLNHSPEYKRFRDKRSSEFLLAVLNYYLGGSLTSHVEQFEVKTNGYHNGKPKQYTIKGAAGGKLEIINEDKKNK